MNSDALEQYSRMKIIGIVYKKCPSLFKNSSYKHIEGRKSMHICKFKFNKEIPRDEIEAMIARAIFTTETLYGKSKVRLSAAYLAMDDKVIVDVSTTVGQHIAEVFVSLVNWEFGETSYSVERIENIADKNVNKPKN